MKFVMVRVDNRLVHGQILEGWLPALRASSIIVVNDDVAADLFRESVIKMAVPSDIDVSVYSVMDFVQSYENGDQVVQRAIVLFKDIDDVLLAYRSGFHYERVNIGNVHDDDGICCVSPATVLNRGDVEKLRELISHGVVVEVQCVPRDKSVNFQEIADDLETG